MPYFDTRSISTALLLGTCLLIAPMACGGESTDADDGDGDNTAGDGDGDNNGGDGDTASGGNQSTGGDSGDGGSTSGGQTGIGGAELCPPCVAPPGPGCVGSGICGCGPYTCPCGENTCPDGLVCCNELQGLCSAPGEGCIQ